MNELTQYLKEVAKQLEIQNAYNELNRASQNNENQATDKFNDTLKAIEDKYAKAMRTLERLRKSRLSRNNKN